MKVAILALLVVCLFATSTDKYIELLGKDTCASKVITTIRPEMDAAVAKNGGLKDTVDVIALLSKAKQMMDACPQETYAPANKDQIENDGIALLLGSNCEKDAGIMFLLADTIVQDPTDYVNDLFASIFEVVLGYQTYKDCSQFEHFVFPHH